MDWLSLLVLVTVVVVPMVVLFGFAGCDEFFGLKRVNDPLAEPTNVRVLSKDVDRIALEWDYPDPLPQGVTFEATLRRDGEATATTQEDLTERTAAFPSLAEGVVYFAQVRAVSTNDQSTSLVPPEPGLQVATLSYQPIFQTAFVGNSYNNEGFTIVQRIEPSPAAPLQAAPRVRLTLRSADNGEIRLDLVTIARAASGNDPYDADTIPTTVAANVTIPTNNVAVLDVAYQLDQSAPYLIAFQVNPAGPGNSRFADNVPPEVGTCYYGQTQAEAGVMDRSPNYDPRPRVELVERVEVPAETAIP